jgi:hypothetical protein
MASVFISSNPPTNIDYSQLDGRVMAFVLRGEKLYDEGDGTESEGWRDRLVELVREQGLDADHSGSGGPGPRAFILRMREDGLLPRPE